jgi:type II secretory ATPase GspE/PulE/Tfp pilus assembly ATPase PilB-like protein
MAAYQEQALAYLRSEMNDAEKHAFEEALTQSAELRAELERTRALLDAMDASGELSIVRAVNDMIIAAIERHASDIHIVPARNGLTVNLRIGGHLHERGRLPKEMQQAVVDRWKVMADMNLNERRVPQDGRIPIRKDGKDYDLRVNIMPTVYGERVTAHITNRSEVLPGLDKLGLSPAQMGAVRRLVRRPSGLVFAAGRGDSGRSTLLYSVLQDILSGERKNIMTIEDPVKMTLEGVSQTSVNKKAGLVFSDALRALLRSDPDVVYCGEIPDAETAEAAVELAQRGRLVLSALNASSALGVVQRLRDMGIEPFLIAETLAGAVGQRLVRKVCPACVTEYDPSPDDLQKAGLSLLEDGPFRRGAGCALCGDTGFRGRVALFEVLEVDHTVRRLIAEGATGETLWQESFGRTGGSLWDDARQKVREGLTTVEEAPWALFDYPQPPVYSPQRDSLFLLPPRPETGQI